MIPEKTTLGRKSARRAAGTDLASKANIHDLYQRAVQDGPSDVDFLERVWHEVYGDRLDPVHFREDFCGTALLCAHWVTRSAERTAEGFDIDQPTLDWGVENNLVPIGDAAARVNLQARDARESGDRPADILCAQNFSYQLFQQRRELADYFRKTRQNLSETGILVLDAFGGTEAVEELKEEREIEDGGFNYVWEQKTYHPATNRLRCRIHFEFEDGSRIKNAFRYDWRLYSIPELRDILLEVGYREVRTYFEEFDEDGDGTGHFARDEKGEACEGWLAYIVAVP
ncbi:class I SAM-dependent methyltransferase [bacterium]|nr:MAG: class I SAM-dependent methyltransferase [bacterium]